MSEKTKKNNKKTPAPKESGSILDSNIRFGYDDDSRNPLDIDVKIDLD